VSVKKYIVLVPILDFAFQSLANFCPSTVANMKNEAAGFSDNFITFYHITLRHGPRTQ
jgi:hypothetical protein